MLKGLFSDILQQILEAEMDEHVEYEKHGVEGNNSGNSRNGYTGKNIKARFGGTDIQVPWDRNEGFTSPPIC